jgi:hypothetical protein
MNIGNGAIPQETETTSFVCIFSFLSINPCHISEA